MRGTFILAAQPLSYATFSARWQQPGGNDNLKEKQGTGASRTTPSSRAHNSAVECHLHTVEVVGSNPAAPTIPSNNPPVSPLPCNGVSAAKSALDERSGSS